MYVLMCSLIFTFVDFSCHLLIIRRYSCRVWNTLRAPNFLPPTIMSLRKLVLRRYIIVGGTKFLSRSVFPDSALHLPEFALHCLALPLQSMFWSKYVLIYVQSMFWFMYKVCFDLCTKYVLIYVKSMFFVSLVAFFVLVVSCVVVLATYKNDSHLKWAPCLWVGSTTTHETTTQDFFVDCFFKVCFDLCTKYVLIYVQSMFWFMHKVCFDLCTKYVLIYVQSMFWFMYKVCFDLCINYVLFKVCFS
jgi:hypothetical protein